MYFYPRPSDSLHDRQHSLHLHPDGAEDEEEEDHHFVHKPGLGRFMDTTFAIAGILSKT